MKTNKLLLLLAASASILPACSDDDSGNSNDPILPTGTERILVVCEGVYGMNNSTVAVISDSTVTNNWLDLGDTGNDIILAADTIIAIAVNASNLIQYVGLTSGADLGSTEIPNVRRLAASNDGRYLYATSYADNGYVARIDISNFSLIDTCHVGYEPEGIAFYNNRLYIANTGGYHDYCESTVSVVDANKMTLSTNIQTGLYNLYGPVSLADKYLLVNASGNYADKPAGTAIINLETEEVTTYNFGAPINCTDGNFFYTISSSYDENWVATYSAQTISVATLKATAGLGKYTAAQDQLPNLDAPYGAYISPVDANLYLSDARNYMSNGFVYAFGNDGSLKGKWTIEGVNPAHFLSTTIYQ